MFNVMPVYPVLKHEPDGWLFALCLRRLHDILHRSYHSQEAQPQVVALHITDDLNRWLLGRLYVVLIVLSIAVDVDPDSELRLFSFGVLDVLYCIYLVLAPVVYLLP